MKDIMDFFFISTITTGVTPYSGEFKTLVFPNPVSEQLFISATSPLLKLELTDLNGKLIVEKNTTSPNEIIDVNTLPAGIYFLNIQGEKGNSIQKISILH